MCGEAVPRNALACPECGADGRSGWREGADSADLPDEDFDYDEYLKKEFGRSPKPVGLKPIWWVTGIILVVALLWPWLRAFFP